jgi:hypothetical protein
MLNKRQSQSVLSPNVYRSNAAPHSMDFMIECGVERVLFPKCASAIALPYQMNRASLLRLLYAVCVAIGDNITVSSVAAARHS